MTCEKVHELLPAFDANHLASGESVLVRDHLSVCTICQGRLESTRKLRSLLALKRHEKPDEFFMRTFTAQFHQKLLSSVIRKRSVLDYAPEWLERTFRSIWLQGAAVAALAILIFFNFYPARQSSESDSYAGASIHDSRPGNKSELLAMTHVESVRNDLISGSDQHTIYVLDRVSYRKDTHEAPALTF